MKNWKQVLAGFSTVALLLTNVGVTTPLSVYAEEETKAELSSGDVTVKLSDGTFPDGAALKAESKSDVTIEEQEVLAAYGLSVEYTEVVTDEDGKEVTDEETGEAKTETKTYTLAEGKTVTVTIKSDSLKDGEKVNVYQDGSEIKSDVTVADNTVSFDASSLDETFVVTKDKEEKSTRNGGTTIGSSVAVTDQTIKTADEKISLKGEMPSGATVAVESKDVSNVDNHKGLLALDISIQYKDGETDKEYEPASGKTIEVTLKNDALKDGTKVNVYHYADETPNPADTVAENVEVSDSTITFNAPAFSKFVVTEADTEDGDTQKTIEIGSIKLEDTVAQDGTLTATFYDKDNKDITSAVLKAYEEEQLTFTWNGSNGIAEALDNDQPNKINVAKDKGAKGTYSLTVKDTTETGEGQETTSNEVKLSYNTELVNGGFENPDVRTTHHTYNASDKWGYIKQEDVPGWSTTAHDVNGYRLEFGRYEGNAHGAKDDKFDNTVGDQYAELNASAAGALYQDVLTDGGAQLSWSLLHHATIGVTNNGSKSNTLYVVVMSTADAEKALSGVDADKQQSVMKTMVEAAVAIVGSGKEYTYSLVSGDNKDKSVTLTVWKLVTESTRSNATGTIVNSCTADGNNGVGSDTTGWAKYSGVYKAPSNQYLTRLLFVSGESTATNGNLLDEVKMSQTVDYTVEYWVWDSNNKKYVLQSEDTQTGTVAPNTQITAENTENYTDYELVGSIKGAKSAGENANPSASDKSTSITVSGTTNYLCLYYSDAVQVTGKITWEDNDDADGDRPEQVEIEILDNEGNVVGTAVANEENGWTYSLNNLPKTDESGNPITYKTRLKGSDPDSYSSSQNGNNFTMKKTAKVEGTLTWIDGDNADGTRPETVTVKVTGSDGEVHELEVKVPADSNELTYSFDDLPKYDADGNKITYTLTSVVTEDGSEYAITYDDNKKDATLKRSAMRKVAGKLTWVDNNNADGIRPDDVTVDVYDAAGNKVGTTKVTVDEDGNWTYSVDDLPKYDENGAAIEYTIKVSTVDGYETTVDGSNITLTHKSKAKDSGKSDDSKSSGKHDGGKYAKVDLYLVDDANTQPLSSGVFALYTSAGELIGTYTTDAAGHIQFPNLKGGSYYLVQLSAPNGYELNGTRVNFTVDGTPLALMLTDKATGAATAAADTAATVAPSDAAAADAATAGPGTENGAAVGGATGDESNMVLYGAATGAAAILLAVWFVMNRRRANG